MKNAGYESSVKHRYTNARLPQFLLHANITPKRNAQERGAVGAGAVLSKMITDFLVRMHVVVTAEEGCLTRCSLPKQVFHRVQVLGLD